MYGVRKYQYSSYCFCVGVVEISGLFMQTDISPCMKDCYISLLEKFEVAVKINDQQLLIPSLMPKQVSYPQPEDVLSDVSLQNELDSLYQPPLHRFWMADFVPAGFWPRLICRVATDQQIAHVSVYYSVTS